MTMPIYKVPSHISNSSIRTRVNARCKIGRVPFEQCGGEGMFGVSRDRLDWRA